MFEKIKDLIPFKNANENTYWRAKALGASVGVGMVAVFFVAEIGIMGTLANRYGLLPSFNTAKQQVALVDISGEITIESSNAFIAQMKELETDERVKSVLIRINSGGGSPAGSDDMANCLLEFQKYKKVYVYIQGIAASGAYYVASSVKPLVANPNAILGSIGVILPHYALGDAAKKLGIEEDNIVAGEYKVPLSVFSKVDTKGKKYLSSNLLQPTYLNFKKFVAVNRGVGLKKIESVADGKIFIASMTEIQGILVDKTDSYTRVVSRAIDECGDGCELIPVEIKKESRVGGLFGIDVNFKGLEVLNNTGVKM